MKPTSIGFAGAALLVCAGAIAAGTSHYWRPAPARNQDDAARSAAGFIVTMLRENHVLGAPVAFPNVARSCRTPQELQTVRDAVKDLVAGKAMSVQAKMLCISHVRPVGENALVWQDPAPCEALGKAIVEAASSEETLRNLAGTPPRVVNPAGRLETGAVDLKEAVALAQSRFDLSRMTYACDAGDSQIRITMPKF